MTAVTLLSRLGKILPRHFPHVSPSAVPDGSGRMKRHRNRRLHGHEWRTTSCIELTCTRFYHVCKCACPPSFSCAAIAVNVQSQYQTSAAAIVTAISSRWCCSETDAAPKGRCAQKVERGYTKKVARALEPRKPERVYASEPS
jgi:hypothetical protein